MDFLTACRTLTAELPSAAPDDPLVRAALDLVIRPWLDGVNSGAQAMRWGSFATEVQTVTDQLWPGPATESISADPPAALPGLDQAAAALALAVAGLLDRAADPRHPRAWAYAAGAAQLRDAAQELQ
ncbi:MAG TPA: hypothetical protein DGT23_29820 [Micromonosporaceae bacterium]|nr:hypothetical protein [Micromonosporaceae bacterium]